jgi:hypothetical protein
MDEKIAIELSDRLLVEFQNQTNGVYPQIAKINIYCVRSHLPEPFIRVDFLIFDERGILRKSHWDIHELPENPSDVQLSNEVSSILQFMMGEKE